MSARCFSKTTDRHGDLPTDAPVPHLAKHRRHFNRSSMVASVRPLSAR